MDFTCIKLNDGNVAFDTGATGPSLMVLLADVQDTGTDLAQYVSEDDVLAADSAGSVPVKPCSLLHEPSWDVSEFSVDDPLLLYSDYIFRSTT